MTFKLTDPFILTNINTTKTSILLFMSRLCPRLSQVKPCNPVLWFLINLIFIWRSEMNKGARESSDTLTLDRKYQSDPGADITSEWSVTPLQPRLLSLDRERWDPQSLTEMTQGLAGGSGQVLKLTDWDDRDLYVVSVYKLYKLDISLSDKNYHKAFQGCWLDICPNSIMSECLWPMLEQFCLRQMRGQFWESIRWSQVDNNETELPAVVRP